MPTKRTTRTFGNKRITNTTSYKNGKTTNTYSESSAGRTKPGQTRLTITHKNGKTNTIRTTNMGNGWYTRSSSAGDERRAQIQTRKSRKFWDEVLGNNKRRSPKKESNGGLVFWCIALLVAMLVFLK